MAIKYFPAVVRGWSALAFAMMALELLLMQHWHGAQQIAPVACIIGMLLAGASVVAPRRARRMMAVVFVVMALIGVLGFFMHLDRQMAAVVAPPVFAPLAMVGVSLLTALACVANDH